MVRAKSPKIVRIQNWIRNWVAGFRPDWPPLGGLREARQMMAAHRPQKKPFALAPQLCHPPHPPALNREFLNPHDENDTRLASFHSRDPKPYVSDRPRNTYWRQNKAVGPPKCVPWISLHPTTNVDPPVSENAADPWLFNRLQITIPGRNHVFKTGFTIYPGCMGWIPNDIS